MTVRAFPMPDRKPLVAATWQARVEQARTVHDVLEACRDYLAKLEPGEVALLPRACRPPKLLDAGDISSYAFELVRHHCKEEDDGARLVHQLAAFFSQASIRVSQVLTRVGSEGGMLRESA